MNSTISKKETFTFFAEQSLMLAKASNTPEYHTHKVQKFTYAQILQELTVTGDELYILLSPTIRSQFNVVAR